MGNLTTWERRTNVYSKSYKQLLQWILLNHHNHVKKIQIKLSHTVLGYSSKWRSKTKTVSIILINLQTNQHQHQLENPKKCLHSISSLNNIHLQLVIARRIMDSINLIFQAIMKQISQMRINYSNRRYKLN